MIEEEIIGSQSEESEESEVRGSSDDNMDDVLSMFEVEPKKEEGEKVDPPIDPPKAEEKKGITVKFNKEETFIEEDKVPELARKGLNYDKVEGRAKELQGTLDRAAKIAGYTDHAAYVADFDRLEQQKLQEKQQEQDTLREDLLSQLELNGVDRAHAEAFIENHPLIKQGKEAIEAIQKVSSQAEADKRWQPLYEAHPELIEDSQAFKRGEMPAFFTPELQALVARGNDPLLAYEHLNRDKIQQQTKKATEQRIIKEQQLGLRSRVETNAAANNETAVPDALANAFAAFDLPVDLAKKYMKK